MSLVHRLRLAAVTAAVAMTAACGSADFAPMPAAQLDVADWSAVREAAAGQTVNWYMYGGDDTLNRFVNGYLADRLEQEHDVTLEQVKITDTVEAVNKVLGEKQAGRNTDGSVDLIWINGENFATGRQANLWYCGYDQALPNAKYVDFTAPAVRNDFGMPVDGCESPWQQANSAVVYDSAKLSADDVASVDALFAWAKANPGRFTYPAPPDFTGSMAVRTFFYATAGDVEPFAGEFDEATFQPVADELFPRLVDIEPALWREGRTYPNSQTQLERLYADGEVDAFFTYGPGAVSEQVSRGVFPESTREAVLDIGNISNVSFVAIPYNSPRKAAALTVANMLLDPQTQLELYRAEGAYPAIELDQTEPAVQQEFANVQLSKSVLPIEALTENALPELASGYVTKIEKDWRTRVLQR